MKISYNSSCLKFLEQEVIDFGIPDYERPLTELDKRQLAEDINRTWPKRAEAFNSKVRYLSRSFYEAYHHAKPKLAALWAQEDMSEAGTLIFVDRSGSWTTTIFYAIASNHSSQELEYVIYYFTKYTKLEYPNLDACLMQGNNKKLELVAKFFTNKGFGEKYFMSELIGILLFIKHAEVETKIIEGNRRGYQAAVKYVNETKGPVEVIDSTWFTNIVRTEGFHVRGFFRLQPVGPGRSERKLTWINDFEKHGYSRKAKKPNHETEAQAPTQE